MSSLKIIGFILALCIISLFAVGQEQIKKYVQEQAVQVTTNKPYSTNYVDLEPIGKAIGDARVVMLGEQDHGDAATFLAKTRLIKYLHKKKGFNVISFESVFFRLVKGWEKTLQGSLPLGTLINQNIF